MLLVLVAVSVVVALVVVVFPAILLNLHFQIVSLSLHRTRTVILSTLGCVNWYASIHFAMSFSGIAW